MRHSCAHLLAQAVKELYGNKAQITIGPIIENGFYYDIKTEDSFAFSVNDFPIIENKMHEIANQKLQITKTEVDTKDAIKYFQSINEYFKCEIIDKIKSSI